MLCGSECCAMKKRKWISNGYKDVFIKMGALCNKKKGIDLEICSLEEA